MRQADVAAANARDPGEAHAPIGRRIMAWPKRLTHLGKRGEARMVDVSEKTSTERIAIAEGHVRMKPTTLALVRKGNAKKGDVLGAARLAGIMAAKRTHELIPLCHPLALVESRGRSRRHARRRQCARRP